MQLASGHHIPHSHYLEWPREDRDAEVEAHAWQSESCGGCGVHPSEWDEKQGGWRNRYVAEWKFCRVCELVSQAQEAGPPTDSPGWRLTLKRNQRPADLTG